MTNKFDFTPEEWKTVVAAGPMVGLAVTCASPNGPWGVLKEMMSMGMAMAEMIQKGSSNPLIAELAATRRQVCDRESLDAFCPPNHVCNDRIESFLAMPRVTVYLLSIAVATASASSANARRHQINPIPFSHEPCSVLSRRPCTPTYCSPLYPGPCIPEIFYPYGENLQLTIETVPSKQDEAKYQRPDHALDSIGDLFAELRSCWSPPPPDRGREGMQMSVRFSFKKSGELIGPPRMTFATSGVPPDIRDTYLNAINSSLDSCLPMKFTEGLGGALAGRPIAIRYVDNRELKRSENK